MGGTCLPDLHHFAQSRCSHKLCYTTILTPQQSSLHTSLSWERSDVCKRLWHRDLTQLHRFKTLNLNTPLVLHKRCTKLPDVTLRNNAMTFVVVAQRLCMTSMLWTTCSCVKMESITASMGSAHLRQQVSRVWVVNKACPLGRPASTYCLLLCFLNISGSLSLSLRLQARKQWEPIHCKHSMPNISQGYTFIADRRLMYEKAVQSLEAVSAYIGYEWGHV